MKLVQRSLFLSAAILLPLMAHPAAAETIKLTFVQTNDIDRMQEDAGRGGFARLAAVLKAERANGNTVFVHSGDTLSPSLLSGIDKGAHQIDILNHMGVDALVPGNHEFDFGPDNFRARIAEATFPVISSNLTEANGSPIAHTVPDRIMEFGTLKVGFYGLTTEDTPTVSSPGDIQFGRSIETGEAKAKELRERGVDIVVAVVHTPLNVDMGLVRAGAADVVLSGHDEHLLAYYDGRHVLTESGSQADRVVVTTLTVDKTEKDGKTTVTWQPAFKIVDTAEVEPDPEIAALVKTYTDKLDAELQVEIGVTETALDLTTVAEGIEHPGQAEQLRRLGCRTGQGYLYAKPLPPDDAHTYLTGTTPANPATGVIATQPSTVRVEQA